MGCRTVAGAVLASGGDLIVSTRGRSLQLVPDYETGCTTAKRIGDWDGAGTEVRVRLGGPWAAAGRAEFIQWTGMTLAVVREAQSAYRGKSSPFWYDSESFFELLHAWTGTVRELIADLDGCSKPKASQIAAKFKGRYARSLGRREADRLLTVAQKYARPVEYHRLGCVGRDVEGFPDGGYHRIGEVRRIETQGTHAAELPVVVECWVEVADLPTLDVLVNRTQVPMWAAAYHDRMERCQRMFAADWRRRFDDIGRRLLRVVLNVDTPYMPLMTDGKSLH